MDAILDIPVLGPTLGVLLPFLIVLGLVIFVHEYGHYIVGRWCGIEADAFSVGFGPEIAGWTDRRGTRWRIAAIPLGGYVKFRGDADAASAPDGALLRELSPEEKRQTLSGAPLWARASTVAAGPVANFLFTIVVLTAVGLAAGRASDAPVLGTVAEGGQAAGMGFRAGDRILAVDGAPIESYGAFEQAMLAEEDRPRAVRLERDGREETVQAAFSRPARISGVTPGGPAEAACIKPGDVILAVEGAPIGSFRAVQDAVAASAGETIAFTIQRGSELRDVSVAPRVLEQPDPTTGTVERRLLIGVTANFNLGMGPSTEPLGLLGSLAFGLEGPWRLAVATFGYLGSWVFGEADGSSIGGPIGIASASGQAAEAGLLGFVVFVATVSTAIGLINLFPIPVLDGGHLLFYGLEAIRGRPLGERAVELAMRVGLGAIMLLMIFATWNDIGRLVNGWFAQCG